MVINLSSLQATDADGDKVSYTLFGARNERYETSA